MGSAELRQLASSLTDEELRFIAASDYGLDVDRHLEALRNLIGPQDLQLETGQHWYPLETIELCAYALTPGHEREFAFCTLFVLDRVREGYDGPPDLAHMFDNLATDYDRLPPELRDAVLRSFLDVERD